MKSLIVFDLDFTLWDAGGTWCDQLSPPFRYHNPDVMDARGCRVRLYQEVQAVLRECDRRGLGTAVASRTYQPVWARQLLDLFGLRDRFHWEEIYPASKVHHFQSLHRLSGIPFERMIFFDDEHRNIRDVGGLGVRAVQVHDGVTLNIFEQAVSGLPTEDE
jgi:magnesium-dependent phosphatase 1